MRDDVRVVLITGSTGGIGRVMAEVFAESGYDVALHGEEEEAEIQKTHLRGYGVEVEYFGADFRNREEVGGLVGRVEAEFGRVDVLVNNAGTQHMKSFESFEYEKWAEILEINLTSSFCLMKDVMGGMVSRGWGRIVNMSSVHGLSGSVGRAAYSASKHGLVGLTKVAGLELAGTGVTCNAICPGIVDTPLFGKMVSDVARERGESEAVVRQSWLMEKQPSGEMVKAEDVARLCLYLCGDSSCSFQGLSFPIDGGWLSQ